MESKELIDNVCNKMVVKSNALIQKSRFDLTTLQQKVVLYLISQIQPEDEDFKLYEFSIRDFCKICGITTDSGRNYEMLKQKIKEIADKSLWVTLENGKETLLRWIEKPYIDEKSGTIQVRLDKDMKPYLLQLQNNFTQYQFLWVLQFKRKYSIRLYELVKSFHYNEQSKYEKVYSLDELRLLMDAQNYNTWQTFKKRALEPAIEEINAFSEKNIEYETIVYGKTVGHIRLTVSTKAYDCLSNAIESETTYEEV